MEPWDTYKCVYRSHFSTVKYILTMAVQSSIHDDTLKVSLKHYYYSELQNMGLIVDKKVVGHAIFWHFRFFIIVAQKIYQSDPGMLYIKIIFR